jgi:2-amino-4-hydroxy-6-hydroxymethyldihydropteridine diphosphokinase
MTKSKSRVLLSLGANLGDARKVIAEAVEFLKLTGVLSDVEVSSFYKTAPVGFTDQPDFVNIAVSGKTLLSPENLLYVCKATEYLFGRQQRERWHERELDIDIVFIDNNIIDTPSFQVPHPRAHERRFVLEPLAEIAPDFKHPVLNDNISNLLRKVV